MCVARCVSCLCMFAVGLVEFTCFSISARSPVLLTVTSSHSDLSSLGWLFRIWALGRLCLPWAVVPSVRRVSNSCNTYSQVKWQTATTVMSHHLHQNGFGHGLWVSVFVCVRVCLCVFVWMRVSACVLARLCVCTFTLLLVTAYFTSIQSLSEWSICVGASVYQKKPVTKTIPSREDPIDWVQIPTIVLTAYSNVSIILLVTFKVF